MHTCHCLPRSSNNHNIHLFSVFSTLYFSRYTNNPNWLDMIVFFCLSAYLQVLLRLRDWCHKTTRYTNLNQEGYVHVPKPTTKQTTKQHKKLSACFFHAFTWLFFTFFWIFPSTTTIACYIVLLVCDNNGPHWVSAGEPSPDYITDANHFYVFFLRHFSKSL